MKTAVVLFTRDLRVHDNPALAAACANAERVVPLFVLDPKLRTRSANRLRFLHQALADLRATLRGMRRRSGDPAPATRWPRRSSWPARCDAEGIAMAADVSDYARARENAVRAGVREAPPLVPAVPGRHRGHSRRRCGRAAAATTTRSSRRTAGPGQAAEWRAEVAAPRKVTLPDGLEVGRLPAVPGRVAGHGRGRRDRRPAPGAPPGSSTSGRTTICTTTWRRRDLAAQRVPPLRLCLAAGAGQRGGRRGPARVPRPSSASSAGATSTTR